MSQSILLIDDEEHMLRLLKFALKQIPATLLCFKRGDEACDHLAATPADIVLLDYSMPGLDGVETLRRIHTLPGGETIKVIMLTARDQTAIREAAAGLNVTAFLTKPFSPSDLARRVRELMV